MGWNEFREIKNKDFPQARLEDPWAEGGSRSSTYLQIRKATAKPAAALRASDARSSTSDAVLVPETIGRRG